MAMRNESFCVLILSHGRPDRVYTLASLQRGHYSGPWYIVVDDEDETLPQYIENFGEDHVVVFNKATVAHTFDIADLSKDYRSVVFPRNASFDIAQGLGYEYHLQLDDDYTRFCLRFEENDLLRNIYVRDCDRLFDMMVDFLRATKAASVCLAQGGDYIGGLNCRRWQKKVIRKAMNSFFLRSDADWRFPGKINEDVNAYTALQHRGYLFLTTMYAMVIQPTTQSNPGGMTHWYEDNGTYMKSFYTVMMCPSAVKVSSFRHKFERIHHHVKFNNCAPCIIGEHHRKASNIAREEVALGEENEVHA